MSKKIFMYAHGGSGNHGCEAIIRSTLQILPPNNVTLISASPEEDIYYDIHKLCRIVKDTDSVNIFSLDFLFAYVKLKFCRDYIPMEKLRYKKSFSLVQSGDIALSVGGDNYCYADVKKYGMLHEMMKKRGAKTVLWGCSVEPDLIDDSAIACDLAKYDLITARETISYKALKKVNPNTILVSDPALQLNTIVTEKITPSTIGINCSPMVADNESVAGIVLKNYANLIRYILEKTDMNILLVPHVIWNDSDDRKILRELLEHAGNSDRIRLLEDMSCEKLKGYISQCRIFIGARTHATIAAYSSCVPTLVVGYSVKARGIAGDLFGTEENYVIPVQQIKSENELIDAFQWLYNKETSIRQHLKNVMPKYAEKAMFRWNEL